MQAKDIMTKPVFTLTPDSTVSEAINLFITNKISGAPVVEVDNSVIGIVTEKDLLVTLDFLGNEKAKRTPVRDFMTKDVISCADETHIKDVLQELVRRNIKRVPILKDGVLVGILSRRNILRSVQDPK